MLKKSYSTQEEIAIPPPPLPPRARAPLTGPLACRKRCHKPHPVRVGHAMRVDVCIDLSVFHVLANYVLNYISKTEDNIRLSESRRSDRYIKGKTIFIVVFWRGRGVVSLRGLVAPCMSNSKCMIPHINKIRSFTIIAPSIKPFT